MLDNLYGGWYHHFRQPPPCYAQRTSGMTFIWPGHIWRTPWLKPDWRGLSTETPCTSRSTRADIVWGQFGPKVEIWGHINVFDMSVRMSNFSAIPNCTSWVNQNYKCMECFHTSLNLIHPTLVFYDSFLMLHGQPSRNRALTANRPGPGRITVSNGAPFGKCFSGPKIRDSPGLHCLFLGIKRYQVWFS